jgi:type-F conjugative transfer system pilin assembly protein TrbC
MKYTKTLFSLLVMTAITSANAQNVQPETDSADKVRPSELNWGLMQQSPDNQSRMEEALRSSQEALDLFKKQNPTVSKDMLDTAAKSSRLIDDIANETTQQQRKEVLASLGINPDDKAALYYFVSWSMPLPLIRAYVVDAMWSGGTVVFKGIPKGEDLGTFITTNMQELVYGKSSAYLSIDPRLFDIYEVEQVPSIVLTSYRENITCKGDVLKEGKLDDGSTIQFEGCKPLDPTRYYKMSGSVTGSYALQAFVDKGATYGEPYLAAIKKGWTGQKAPGESQKGFEGQWESVFSPEQLQAIESAKNAVQLDKIAPAVSTSLTAPKSNTRP